MKKLLLVLLAISACADAMAPAAPAVVPAVLTATATTTAITTQQTTLKLIIDNSLKVFKAFGLLLNIKGTIENPINAGVVYGLSQGVGVAYPPFKEWLALQMSGKSKELTAKRDVLLAKKHLAHLHKNELATLNHMISMKITQMIGQIANGTLEEAQGALQKLYAERMLYEIQKRSMSMVRPTINALELLHAENLFKARFNVEPIAPDMINSRGLRPRDVIRETANEVFADLDITKFKSFEAFLKEVSDRTLLLKNMGLFSNALSPEVTAEKDKLGAYISQVNRTLASQLKPDEVVAMSVHIAQMNGYCLSPDIMKEMHNRSGFMLKLSRFMQENTQTYIDSVTKTVIVHLNNITSNANKLPANRTAVIKRLVDDLVKNEQLLHPSTRPPVLTAVQQPVIFMNQPRVEDSSPLLAYTDMSLTMPTNPDLLFRQKITANPETNFREYLIQVRDLLNDLKVKGLYTAQQVPLFMQEVAYGTAKHLAYAAQHPVQYTQRFVEANMEFAKEATLFFIDVYSSPEELYVNERELQLYQETAVRRGQAIAHKYNELCEIIPQMTRSEWANVTSSIIADGLILRGAGKGIQFAKKCVLAPVLKTNPLFAKIHETVERSLAQQVEMVTTEGVTLKAPQTEFAQNTNVLQNAVEKKILGIATKTVHPNGIYKDAAYHTPKGNAVKSPRPINGQHALDNSFQVKPEKPRRIAISHGQFVVLDQTLPGEFHGHIREWHELDIYMQNVLKKAGLVKSDGKIVK